MRSCPECQNDINGSSCSCGWKEQRTITEYISPREFFIVEIERLFRFFSDSKTSNRGVTWYELWEKNYSSTKNDVISKMVDKAAGSFDRPPTYAQFLGLRSSCMDILEAKQSKHCFKCSGSGSVGAIRTEGEYISGDTCFRCPNCQNWRGVFSEAMPVWDSKYESNGYKLKVTVSGPVNIHMGNFKYMVKGLAEQKKMAV